MTPDFNSAPLAVKIDAEDLVPCTLWPELAPSTAARLPAGSCR
jgi:hypothetical protein